MKSNDHNNHYGPEGPEMENTLMLRYLLKRYDEMLESDDPKISTIFGAISVASVGLDKESETELRRILFPLFYPDHALLQRCRDILLQTLERIEAEELPERLPSSADDLYLDERDCRKVLVMALREGKRMISEDNFEFAKVLESIGWIALQRYPRRLNEFGEAWKSCQDDPKEATEKAVKILRSAFIRRDEEELSFPSQDN